MTITHQLIVQIILEVQRIRGKKLNRSEWAIEYKVAKDLLQGHTHREIMYTLDYIIEHDGYINSLLGIYEWIPYAMKKYDYEKYEKEKVIEEMSGDRSERNKRKADKWISKSYTGKDDIGFMSEE